MVPHLDLENDQETIHQNCATHLGRVSSCICLAPYSKCGPISRLRQTPPVLLDTNGQWRTQQLLATRHTSVGIVLNYQVLWFDKGEGDLGSKIIVNSILLGIFVFAVQSELFIKEHCLHMLSSYSRKKNLGIYSCGMVLACSLMTMSFSRIQLGGSP